MGHFHGARSKKSIYEREGHLHLCVWLQAKWFELQKNSSVYVSGLPVDATEAEMVRVFTKCGVIKLDDDAKPRVKVYRCTLVAIDTCGTMTVGCMPGARTHLRCGMALETRHRTWNTAWHHIERPDGCDLMEAYHAEGNMQCAGTRMAPARATAW